MTPKSKSPGEGSIRMLPSGRFHGELTLGRKQDGRRNVFRVTCNTKEEVRAAFRRAHRDYEAGQLVTNPRQTAAQFLRQWLADVAAQRVSSRTLQGYRELIELHAIPTFGAVKLAMLTPAHLQRLYKAKLETLSAQRVLHLHRCLHSAFETAVRWELCRYNLCDRVDAPRVERREQQALSPEQAIAFYDAALSDEGYGPYFIVALVTGLRSGELYALQWKDVDLKAQRLTVSRAYSRVRGQGRVLKTTKTGRGRAVHLLSVAVDALQRQKRKQAEWRLKAGEHWQDRGLVFATHTGAAYNEGDTRLRFLAILERAGLPRMRPYDLRHSAASLYLALGTQPRDVSALLGHSTIATTMDVYAQSFQVVRADAMQRLDELLRRTTGHTT